MLLPESSSALNVIIEDLELRLRLYSQKKNPSKVYIEKQQALIDELKSVHETLEFYSLHSLYPLLNKEISYLLKVDKQIQGFHIRISFCPNPKHVAFLPINFYPPNPY